MAEIDIQALAQYLNNAELNRTEISKVTLEYPTLDVNLAYDVQHAIVALKQAAGHSVVGLKMGLTSQTKMKQMNVTEPIYGHIFDYQILENDGRLKVNELIHPRVEAEIGFVLGNDLQGADVKESDVFRAIQYAFPALDVVDSRFTNFDFTLPDVVADNASTARVVVGEKFTSPAGLDLDLLGVTLSINGEIADLGVGAAVLGHPLKSLTLLVRMLSRRGLGLKAGTIILSGGITRAIHIKPGDLVRARVHTLGEVGFSVG